MMADAQATYVELADSLESTLADLAPGTKLASENELAAEHDVSRITARAALMELESRHLVVRTRGSGTYVALRIPYPIQAGMAPSWSAVVEAAGHTPEHRYLRIGEERASAQVARDLLISRGRLVAKVERLNLVDGKATGFQTSYLPASDVPGLADVLPGSSLTRTLIDHYDLTPQRWSSRAELATVTTDVAAHLEVTGRPPAWRIDSINICRNLNRPVEVTQGWMRADAFRVFLAFGPGDGAMPPSPGQDTTDTGGQT